MAAGVKPLTVEDFLESKRQSLALELLTDGTNLQRRIEGANISSPGLLLAGYTARFPRGRIQVLGETEISYLRSLAAEELRRVAGTFFDLDMPAVIVTKGLKVPPVVLEIARERGVPMLRSQLKTGEFYRRVQPYLEEQFAPTTTMHGSLADVYGVGLLFVGPSGIGKSECVLDLVERGHRLVADDLVYITRRGNDVLIGRGHELQRHHMEIRGIGIIDISALFGIRAIRQQKRIEVVVQLEEWSDRTYYDRTGLEAEEVEILSVKVPKVIVPLNPGKNITVISEVVAMNHLLKYSGIHAAAQFDKRLREAMRPIREYLEEDYE
ncbi:MAG: HPr(Ser) kinase/phosphatase [Gemmatimonadetes bacterium]|nr:HPr(Ser) kinase/phosphatase [Gemmatimonadota bacterium]